LGKRWIAWKMLWWNTAKNSFMEFLRDLWYFMKERKKYWLVPIIIVMLLFGLLIVFGGGSALAPFIYTLF